MKKLVLLDLDRTLFDSVGYRERVYQEIATLLSNDDGVSETCEAVAKDVVAKSGFFDPVLFANRLCEYLHVRGKENAVAKLFLDTKKTGMHFYKEVIDALALLTKEGRVGIYSQGFEEHQRAKLHRIKHCLNEEHIHILRDKKMHMEQVFRMYKDYTLYFVDDILTMLALAKKVRPDIITIWMHRWEDKRQQEVSDFAPDAIVANLREVVAIVRGNE